MVTISEDRHPFHEGDLVTFSDVRGMVELNGCDPRPVHVLGNSQFTIDYTSSFSPYMGYGWCTQVKQPRVMHFQSLEDANKYPRATNTYKTVVRFIEVSLNCMTNRRDFLDSHMVKPGELTMYFFDE